MMNEQGEYTEYEMLLSDERCLKREIVELEAMLDDLQTQLKQVQTSLLQQ